MHGIPSRTMRHRHGSRVDPEPTGQDLLLCDTRRLKAALLAIANKHSTHPIAVDIRIKTMKIRTDSSINFHWIKGHTGLKGNERADYLARTIASYNPTISYDAIPVSRGNQILEDYYIKIWNGTYVNSEKAKHTKTLIPSIFHRLDLPLWPNYSLTQLLTNHGCFRSYLYKMGKVPTSICNCPEKSEQTARHLILDCSLLSKERPTALQTITLPQITKYNINTVDFSRIFKASFHMLQDQQK